MLRKDKVVQAKQKIHILKINTLNPLMPGGKKKVTRTYV